MADPAISPIVKSINSYPPGLSITEKSLAWTAMSDVRTLPFTSKL